MLGNGDNRLAQGVNSGSTTVHAYGPDGSRIKTVATVGAGPAQTTYLVGSSELDASNVWTCLLDAFSSREAVPLRSKTLREPASRHPQGRLVSALNRKLGPGRAVVGDSEAIFKGRPNIALIDQRYGVSTTYLYEPSSTLGVIVYSIVDRQNALEAIFRSLNNLPAPTPGPTAPMGGLGPGWAMPPPVMP